MRKYTLIIVFSILAFVLFSGCKNSPNVGEPFSSGDTAGQTTTQPSAEEVAATENSSSDSFTTAATTQSAAETARTSITLVNSSISNRKEDDKGPSPSDAIIINSGEYFAEGGKRLVDMTEPISKEEFLKKYPISLPVGFAAVDFYFQIPTEDGLRLNEVENGYIRCESKDGGSSLHVYICKTRYVGYGSVWRPNNEPQKSCINKTNVIISKQDNRVYRGQFEKNGYYYTFEMSNMTQEEVVSALNDLVD